MKLAFFYLVLEINAFDAVADARKHLVRDGVEHIAKHSDGQMLAKNLNLIALLTRDIGDINQRYIHTDITYVLGLLTIDEAIAMAIAQVTIQTIGIANRYGGDDGIAIELALATIAHGLALRHSAHLENGGLKRRNGVENAIVAWINAIEAKAQTTHIHLAIGEVLDASRVVHVAQNLMREGGLKLLTASLETLELEAREVVEIVAIGAYEVAEH